MQQPASRRVTVTVTHSITAVAGTRPGSVHLGMRPRLRSLHSHGLWLKPGFGPNRTGERLRVWFSLQPELMLLKVETYWATCSQAVIPRHAITMLSGHVAIDEILLQTPVNQIRSISIIPERTRTETRACSCNSPGPSRDIHHDRTASKECEPCLAQSQPRFHHEFPFAVGCHEPTGSINRPISYFMNACTAPAPTVVAVVKRPGILGMSAPTQPRLDMPPVVLHLFFGRRHIRLPMSSRPVGTKWDGSCRDEVAFWSRFRVIAPRSNSPEHVPNHFGLTSSRLINVLLSSLSGSSHPQTSCHMATASYCLVCQALESFPILS